MKLRRLTPPEPTEHELQADLMARLRRRKYLVVRINGGGFKTPSGFFWAYVVQGLNLSKGFPDVLALRGKDGRIEARLLEVKRLGGKLSPEQKQFAAFAKLFGVEVELVEGLAGLDSLEV